MIICFIFSSGLPAPPLILIMSTIVIKKEPIDSDDDDGECLISIAESLPQEFLIGMLDKVDVLSRPVDSFQFEEICNLCCKIAIKFDRLKTCLEVPHIP